MYNLANQVSSLVAISVIGVNSLASTAAQIVAPQPHELASHTMSLDSRQPDPFVNLVFKDNILLTLKHLEGQNQSANVDWTEVEKPFTYTFKLEPNQVFAFHDSILDQYKGQVVKTTNSHFSGSEGFKSDGYLMGDGVCHLASLINWVAKDAHLDSNSPHNHDFAAINEVPKEYGSGIFSTGSTIGGEQSNLYIKDNLDKPIQFKFEYDGHNLKVTVLEDN